MISSKQNNSFIRSPLNQLETQVARARSFKSARLNNSVPTRSNSVPSRIALNSGVPPRSKLRTMDPRDPRYPKDQQSEKDITDLRDPYAFEADDNESLYSFESVSTNGRLLDRLDFDHDDHRRDSVASMQSTGRLLDRLDLDRSQSSKFSIKPAPSSQAVSRRGSYTPSRSKPITALPSATFERHPSLSSVSSQRIPTYKKHTEDPQKENAKVNVRSVTQNIVFHNTTASVDSFTADIASIESASAPFAESEFVFHSDDSFDSDIERRKSDASDETTRESSTDQIGRASSLHYTRKESIKQNSRPDHGRLEKGSYDPERSLPETPADRPPTRNHNRVHSDNSIQRMEISRTPSAPSLRSRERQSKPGSPSPPRRVASDTSSGRPIYPTPSNTPLGSDVLTPETRTNLALKLRTMGNHREASYQLQISANPPYNYPRAMYLYSMALRFGNGVKQNDRHAVKWLCKCVITSPSYNHSSEHLFKMIERLNALSPEDLIKLILNQLKSLDDALHNGEDPFYVYDKFRALPKAQIAKMAAATKNQTDILAQAYHELGQTLINGWGLATKDEENGIKLLSKAGALGNTASMIELGEIWNTKTKYHKKDHNKAAAWLRASEIFGVSLIGNSWIYKEKYMQPKK